MTELQKPKGRKRKYAEYDELLNSLKGVTQDRPIYINGIGLCTGKRGATAWLKIRLRHGGVYKGRSFKVGQCLELRLGIPLS